MNQSDFVAITCNLLKAWEKSRVQGEFGLASHWLKNWREIFKQITMSHYSRQSFESCSVKSNSANK